MSYIPVVGPSRPPLLHKASFRRPTTQGRHIGRIASSAAEQSRPEYVPGKISDPNYVRIFDTTLRDGEQSPGATMTSKEKLCIANQLAKLGVDTIEAGFPIASQGDFEAVQKIAQIVGNKEQPHNPMSSLRFPGDCCDV